MPRTPEDEARDKIDAQLAAAGWVVQDASAMNIGAARGVAVREFVLSHGHGKADYLLYADRKALGVIDAKAEGTPLTRVEVQAERYAVGMPARLPAWHRPLPFVYLSTGAETIFTNLLDPAPRRRLVFSFPRPATGRGWAGGRAGVAPAAGGGRATPADYLGPSTFLGRLRSLPPLVTTGMRKAQVEAIQNLEGSLAAGRPRSLVQMATGSGKTYMAVAEVYRLLRYAGARRVLFLVDRGNLGRQALGEFQQYATPDDGRRLGELFNVQLLSTNAVDPVSRVCIGTIQRLYSILKGEPELPAEADEVSALDALPTLRREPLPVLYNPALPIETFDVIITDECHRSIYNLWRQVLEYFDATLIGLTATPSKQTLGFFKGNLVMEYNHARAVADEVNVDFDVYRIRTQITAQGATVDAGAVVDRRDRRSRRVRWEELEEDLTYTPNQLDRAVVSEGQIRTIVQTFRDRFLPEVFPERTHVPKTLIFAKDDSHADDIVKILREEFGKGNQFCEKITYRTSTARIVERVAGPDGVEQEQITYRTTGIKPEDLLSSFRNSYYPRIAVTVDMIATGTDVKPLEVVFFLRDVKSANYFEQMKGRGSRVISPDDLRLVTPDAPAKTRFVVVDAVGVCERERNDSPTLNRQPSVSFARVLQVAGQGGDDEEVVATLASRLARLGAQLSEEQHRAIERTAGVPLRELAGARVEAVDPDLLDARAQERFGTEEPSPEQVEDVGAEARRAALEPFLDPALRALLLDLHQDTEQTIDRVSEDTLLVAGHSDEARQKAEGVTESFAAYLREHKDEIAALQILYSRPYGKGLTLGEVKALAATLRAQSREWAPEHLWQAYEMLRRERVRGHGGGAPADLVSLVRFALEREPVLAPFAETVRERFEAWLARREAAGRHFTPEQRWWLEAVRDHIAGSVRMELDDFDSVPFNQKGGLGKVWSLFGPALDALLAELNEELIA